MVRYGMAVDLKKCIGCHTCTIACKAENGTRPGIFWNMVLDREKGQYPAVKRTFVPTLCMHCNDAPCVKACPTGASYTRKDGLVLIDRNKCVGCRYCMLACPYGARYFNKDQTGYFAQGHTPYEKLLYEAHTIGVVEKCTFCAHRIDKGEEPACVKSCPMRARTFGDLRNPDSEVSQLVRSRHGSRFLQELGTEPSVYYLSP